MKLGRGVLAAVRGVTGAALIATASAGCATASRAEVALTPPAVEPAPQADPMPDEPLNEPDYAAACGRG
jgi:hypothetical protein